MPGYRAHLACALGLYGIVLFLVGSTLQSWMVGLGGLVAMGAGALFPDIDIKSKGQHYLYRIYALILIIVLFFYWRYSTQMWIDLIICIALITIAPMLARHRGITHSPPFIMLLGLGVWVIGAGLYPAHTATLFFYAVCFMLGALSHVWLDKRRIFFYK